MYLTLYIINLFKIAVIVHSATSHNKLALLNILIFFLTNYILNDKLALYYIKLTKVAMNLDYI